MAEYGMLAKDDIEDGEILFTIPRSALLHQGTTKVSTLLEKGDVQRCKDAACLHPSVCNFLPFPSQSSRLCRARRVGFPCCWLCCMNTHPHSPTGKPTSLCGQTSKHWIIPCSGEEHASAPILSRGVVLLPWYDGAYIGVLAGVVLFVSKPV